MPGGHQGPPGQLELPDLLLQAGGDTIESFQEGRGPGVAVPWGWVGLAGWQRAAPRALPGAGK